MQVIPDAGLDHPGLAPYRTLRRPWEHFRQRLFIAEGGTVVERLLRAPPDAGLVLRSMLLCPERFARLEPLLRARSEDFAVYILERRLAQQLVGFNWHQGALALAQCPPEPRLEDLPARAKGNGVLLVALDGLSQAENVGLIARSCAALGAHGLLAGETACSPYLRRAVRNSLGGVFRLPCLHPENLAEALLRLREQHGFRLIAADPHGPLALADYRFPPRVCLAVGQEHDGLSEAVKAACQDFVAIPMANQMDSLNVAAAAAVFLHEYRRQHPWGLSPSGTGA